MFGVGVGVGVGRQHFGSGVAPYVGLLDTYPNAAAAYSVRLLKSDYTGNAIRVRRSSDNAEQNIGFDGSGNLDTTALTSFCGSGNGFVTTWYDQSGNGVNLVQTTAINQPTIVTSGVVSTTNSRPSIDFSSHFLRSVSNYSVNQLLSTFAILYPTAAGTSPGADIFGQYFAPTPPYNIWSVETYNTNKFSASYSDGSAWNTPQLNSYTNNVQYQITTIYDSTVITQRLDGANQLTTTRSGSFNTTASSYLLGAWPADIVPNAFTGTIQEVIIYPAIQNSTNIAAIETNELTYF
jgi:hypothetical protein